MVDPLRIFEGLYANAAGETARYMAAVYPPQFYGYWHSWACALRFSFGPDVVHFGYGRDAEHAIERAVEEARGFAVLANGRLVAEDGLDFETFAAHGRKLPWDDDVDNHPALASYTPPRREPKVYPTPNTLPIKSFRGWRTIEGEMEEVVGAIYAPDCDDEGRWGCIVSCAMIIGSNKRITGIDAERSLEAADQFLTGLWTHFVGPKSDRA